MAALLDLGWFSVLTSSGALAAGAKLYTYEAGTTTDLATYSDSGLTIANTNPVVADSAGRFGPIYLQAQDYRIVLKTAADVTIATRDPVSGAADASSMTFTQSGTGAVEQTVQAKLRQVVNVKDFGAASNLTTAQNKAKLQLAIAAVNAAGGGQIIVDYDINYGVKTRTASTWPDFTGVTAPIVIVDYSEGDTYAPGVYPAIYDGAQVRYWTFTPQTTTPGSHDGNTQWLRGAWAPAYCISVDSNLAAVGSPARTASDNYRAYYATMVDGSCSWQVGNGTLAGAAYTKEELSNFVIEKFDITGDTIASNYTPYLVERKTGNVSYSGGRNAPGAHHHFEATTGSPALNIGMFESKSTSARLVLRNSNGSGDDIALRNVSGALWLEVPALGSVLEASKTTRNVGIGVTPSYRLDVSASVADYASRIVNLDASNPYIARWEGTGAAGSGWTFLEAYSSAGADKEFQLRGDGNGTCDGSWTGGGADYAEYFEWADGNPGGEDRRGVSVVLVGDKIRPAVAGDMPIGVVSGNPSVVGDAAPFRWAGKYLRDEYGTLLTETYETVRWIERVLVEDAIEGTPDHIFTRTVDTDEGPRQVTTVYKGREAEPARYREVVHSYPVDAVPAGLSPPDDAKRATGTRRVLNPQWSGDEDYVPRADRPEWACVGLVGKLRVRKGQPVDPRWIQMREVSANVDEWLVR